MSATITTTLSPNDLAKAKLNSGERLANYRSINGGHTARYDVMRDTKRIARVEVTDGHANRYSLSN